MVSLLGRRNVELSPEQIQEKQRRHVYYAMKARCTNPNHPKFKDYGGRGIQVCDRWLGADGLINFYEDMGDRPSSDHSLDRIDNDGNYEPSNCRWSSRKQQQRNKRTAKVITYQGQSRSAAEWAEIYNLPPKLLRYRLSKGWNVDRALTQPVNPNLSRR
jgi:hypothetical protein